MHHVISDIFPKVPKECDCSWGNFTHSILQNNGVAVNKWINTLTEIIFR